MTAYGSAENAVEALKAGAFDYLTKPVDLKQFRTVVASAIQRRRRRRRSAPRAARHGAAQPARSGRPPAAGAAAALQRLVGESQAMRPVKERIAKVARSMAPVLVRGESGTGKELVARAIHACSHRADGPVRRGQLQRHPRNLLEAEFFGARKGSYTGAAAGPRRLFPGGARRHAVPRRDRRPAAGHAVQAAARHPGAQVRSLGSTQEDAVDVRIVSATHKDLAADVQAGRFRQDLYLPAQRDRDPGAAAARAPRGPARAVRGAAGAHRAGVGHAGAGAVARGAASSWPRIRCSGNVRELENLLHRAVALSDGEELQVDFAPTAARPAARCATGCRRAAGGADRAAAACPADLQAYLDQQEREILVQALRETGFNRTAAAPAPGPEPAPDPLPHRAAGDRHARRRRAPMTTPA